MRRFDQFALAAAFGLKLPGQHQRWGSAGAQAQDPWRDGTTHLVMLPLEFMQRLAALVPRPRLHLIRLVSA